jgi:hypothetical protein
MIGSRSDTGGERGSRHGRHGMSGHRKAVARSLGISLKDLAPRKQVKPGGKKSGPSVLELAASAALLTRSE